MPRFSVIMPAYNRHHLIRAAVESVLNQTFADFELIVVDDGSTDGTLEVLRDLADDRVTLMQQANAGPGAARNRGMQQAAGDYIAFLDSDDLYLPWTLQTYADAIEQADEPSMLISAAKEFAEENELKQIMQEVLAMDGYADYFAAAKEDFWIGASVVAAKRTTLLAVGGFNNAKVNQEDCDLWLKLGNEPGFVAIRQPICSGRRWHDQNVSHETDRNVQGVQYLISQYKNNHYPKGNPQALLTILTRHIRPAALACLRQGQRKVAWSLYRQSFAWNLALGRWRFLIGFPIKAIFNSRTHTACASGASTGKGAKKQA